MNYFINTEKQPKAWRVPTFYSKTRFEMEQVKFSSTGSTSGTGTVPFLRAFANYSAGTQNFYERRLSWIFPAADGFLQNLPWKGAQGAQAAPCRASRRYMRTLL